MRGRVSGIDTIRRLNQLCHGGSGCANLFGGPVQAERPQVLDVNPHHRQHVDSFVHLYPLAVVDGARLDLVRNPVNSLYELPDER